MTTGGQSTILSLSDDRATGEAYCLAHHVMVNGDKRRLDTLTKIEGRWLFSERPLYVDWVYERALS
jgi:hypothetical protein